MEADRKALRKRLKEAGLSDPLIDAAWPTWWSDEAFSSQSAKAELRFAIARKLGLSPKSLFHDEVEFVWKDEARFKHLSNETDTPESCPHFFRDIRLPSPGAFVATGSRSRGHPGLGTAGFHSQIRPFIDLQALLATCWAIGVPVIHLESSPCRPSACTRWP